MATPAALGTESANAKLVAPPWHTAALVALFLLSALGGAYFQRQGRAHPETLQQHPNVVPLYLSLIAMEWGLFVYVWRAGLLRTGTKLRELIGGRWTNARDVLVDVAFALGLWGFWTLLDLAWVHWHGYAHAASIQTMLPQRALEILLWIPVSISAGVCEEFVFRGYFQKQFEAFTHSKETFVRVWLRDLSHRVRGVPGARSRLLDHLLRHPPPPHQLTRSSLSKISKEGHVLVAAISSRRSI